VLLEQAAGRIKDAQDRRIVEHALEQLRDDTVAPSEKHAVALDAHLAGAMERHPDRAGAARWPSRSS
jgi:hypothetical protein